MIVSTVRRFRLPALGLVLLLLPGCLVAIGQEDWKHDRRDSDHVFSVDWGNEDPELSAGNRRRADDLERRLEALERQLELIERQAPRSPSPPAQPAPDAAPPSGSQ